MSELPQSRLFAQGASPAGGSASPSPDRVEDDTATERATARRPRWHRLYFLLAAFGVLAVCASLTLNHRLIEVHTRSLRVGEHLVELRGLAGAVNAPGNDVFDSHDVAGERERLECAKRHFLTALERTDVLLTDGATAQIDVCRSMHEMVAESEHIFGHLLQGRGDLAGQRMATMDRKYAELNELLARLELGHYWAQSMQAERLQNIEIWIAGTIVVMVVAAVTYGHRLSRQVQASEDERARYTQKLERVNREHRSALAQVAVLDAAVRSAANAILIADREGRISWVNPATVELTGYGEGELIGTRLEPISSETLRLPELTQAGVWEGQVVSRRKDGRSIIEEQTIAPVLGPTGLVDHFVAIRRDVTRQRQAEEELNAAHEELRLILDSISSILVVLDNDGLVCHWNLPAERAFGWSAGQAVGKRFSDLELPFDPITIISGLAACRAEQRDKRLEEVSYTRPGGGPGFFGFTLSPMRRSDGELHGCLVLAREITERKDLEAQLSRAQKLESLGHLAAGIAHEINTPTQFVNDNTKFLKSSLQELAPLLAACDRLRGARADGPEADALLAQLLAAAERVDVPFVLAELPMAIDDSLNGLERIAGIVRAMKEFSHPGSGSKELADVNRCIRSTVTVARNEWRYVATVELELDPALPLVPCYPQSLNQVVLNMLVNAAHAIEDARKKRVTGELGRITIGTRVCANELEIRISDTGCGIPTTIRERIFDPFFTTKEVGKGTGQGLAIVHNAVVKKHGGRIALESEVGKGTTFFVYLPLVTAGSVSEPELAAR